MSYQEFDALPQYEQASADSSEPTPTRALPLWSGMEAPPEVGALVDVSRNRMGSGKVVGYFVEAGWLGVRVKLASPPDWYREEQGADAPYLAFGVDLASAASMSPAARSKVPSGPA